MFSGGMMQHTDRFLSTIVLSVLVLFHLIIPVGASSMWSQTYGGPEGDSAGAMVQTSDRGYAIAGWTSSFGASPNDFWLVKVDSSGNMEWNRTYGVAGNNATLFRAVSLVQTSDGGYAIAGGNGSMGESLALFDFWLVKVDSSGNLEWSKTYGRGEVDVAYSVVQTSDGGYALAGETGTFGTAFPDCWLVKTDSSGDMEWNQTYGGWDMDIAYSLIQTSDGGYALAGETTSFGADIPNFWLVKTDSSGNMEWNHAYGGNGQEIAFSLVQTNDGGYALAGETRPDGKSPYDFWLVKTDSSGNMEWNQTYGGPDGDVAFSVVEASDGGYALAGYTESFGAGGFDFWLVKVDSSGNIQWNQTYGESESDSAQAMVQTSDGGYALAGKTTSFGAGVSDAWLIKTDEAGVIPEFPSLTILPLLLVATFVIIVCKKRLPKTPNQQSY